MGIRTPKNMGGGSICYNSAMTKGRKIKGKSESSFLINEVGPFVANIKGIPPEIILCMLSYLCPKMVGTIALLLK